MSDELKIVIGLKGTRGSVGIQAPDCDPIVTMTDGDLDAILERVPELVAEARQKWAEAPRYPKSTAPLPSQQTPVASPPRTTGRQTPAPSPQQKLF